MVKDHLSRLTAAGESALASISRKWRSRHPAAEAEPEESEDVRRKKAFLAQVATCVRSGSAPEMTPLQYDPTADHKAVFLVTIPISFGTFQLSDKAYRILAKHVGMSLGSVSHWALCVIDTGIGTSYCYDLMSDRIELTMLGKNYFRVAEITPEIVPTWNSCYYVGETTKSHQEIQELGTKYMTLHPRYHLLSSNCQHLVDDLVKELCNGKVISQAKLDEELSLVSPRIARDLMVARLRSRIDAMGEKEDSDDVQKDLALTRKLSMKVDER